MDPSIMSYSPGDTFCSGKTAVENFSLSSADHHMTKAVFFFIFVTSLQKIGGKICNEKIFLPFSTFIFCAILCPILTIYVECLGEFSFRLYILVLAYFICLSRASFEQIFLLYFTKGKLFFQKVYYFFYKTYLYK